MLSKAKFKYIRSLERKKQRQRYDKFVAEGTKIVEEMLLEPALGIECVVATSSWVEKYGQKCQNTKLHEVSERELKSLSFLQTPHEVLAVATPLKRSYDEALILQDISLYLDGIQDPGNLGTILRVADWFGISHVFLGKGTVDVYNPKVVQSSMGAFLRVNSIEMELEDLIQKFPQVRIMGADIQGENIFELKDREKKGVVIIGNEGKGISDKIRSQIKHWITIPAQGKAESLNAGVATGIICATLRNG